MKAWLDRLFCFFCGHGPFNEGRIGMQQGKFCMGCGIFIPELPRKPH